MKRAAKAYTSALISVMLVLSGCGGGARAGNAVVPNALPATASATVPRAAMSITIARGTINAQLASSRKTLTIPAGTLSVEVDAYQGTLALPAAGTAFYTASNSASASTACVAFPADQSEVTVTASVPIGAATVVIGAYSGACNGSAATGQLLSQAAGNGTATSAGGGLGAAFFGLGSGAPIDLALITLIPSNLPNNSTSQIVFASDRSLLFTAAGQKGRILAVGPGNSNVAYSSSDPAVATVTADGTVTAVGASIGSATITVSAPGAAPAFATAVFAKLNSNAHFIPSESVINADESAATLQQSAITSAISVGDIIFSGDRGGLLGRVTSLNHVRSTIAVGLASVGALDPFSDIKLDFAVSQTAPQFISTGAVSPQSLFGDAGLDFSCESTDTQAELADFKLAGQSITSKNTVNFSGNILKVANGPAAISLGADLHIGYDVNPGTISADAGINGVGFDCSHKFDTIDLVPFVYIFAVGLAGSIEPSIGVEGNIALKDSVTIGVPKFSTSFSRNYQLIIDASGNVEESDSGTPVTTTIDVKSNPSSFAADSAFKTSLDGYAKAELGISLFTLHRNLVTGNVFAIKPNVGAEFSIGTDPATESSYTAPKWSAAIAVPVEFEAKLDLGKFGILLGLPAVGKVTFKPITLYKQELVAAPKVTVSVVPDTTGSCSTSVEATIADDALFPLDYVNTPVTFYAFDADGNRSTIGTANASLFQTDKWLAELNWQAPRSGLYTIQAESPDAIFPASVPDAGSTKFTCGDNSATANVTIDATKRHLTSIGPSR